MHIQETKNIVRFSVFVVAVENTLVCLWELQIEKHFLHNISRKPKNMFEPLNGIIKLAPKIYGPFLIFGETDVTIVFWMDYSSEVVKHAVNHT